MNKVLEGLAKLVGRISAHDWLESTHEQCGKRSAHQIAAERSEDSADDNSPRDVETPERFCTS